MCNNYFIVDYYITNNMAYKYVTGNNDYYN